MASRWQHFTAMVLIGDGLLALVRPRRDAKAWKLGPEPWRSLMGFFANKPELTRVVGVAQVAVGIWWVMQTEKAVERGKLAAL